MASRSIDVLKVVSIEDASRVNRLMLQEKHIISARQEIFPKKKSLQTSIGSPCTHFLNTLSDQYSEAQSL
jgi:hypothetical protein